MSGFFWILLCFGIASVCYIGFQRKIKYSSIRRIENLKNQSLDLFLQEWKEATQTYPISGEKSWDVLIVGAGVAGAALGCTLGKQRVRTLVLEKSLECDPKRIVGEYMHPGGILQMARLGLSHCLQSMKTAWCEGILFRFKGKHAVIKYPKGHFAWSFHHHHFVTKLREELREQETSELRQGTVIKLLHEQDRVCGALYKTQSGDMYAVRAALVVVCDGIGSKFRALLHRAQPEPTTSVLAWTISNGTLPLKRHAMIQAVEQSPIVSYPLSDTDIRFSFYMKREELPTQEQERNEFLEARILPKLPQEMQEPFRRSLERAEFKSMRAYELPAHPIALPGMIMMGACLQMHHPYTGGGMTKILFEIEHLMRLIDKHSNLCAHCGNFGNTEKVDAMVLEWYNTHNHKGAIIQLLADGIHEILMQQEVPELQEALFRLVSDTGHFQNRAAQYLGGLCTSHISFFKDLALLLFLTLWSTLSPFPTPFRLQRAIRIIRMTTKVFLPRLQHIYTNGIVVALCSFASLLCGV